ncbi:GSCOCG00009325001-RA-CDS [Cotesia congregata]|uniref:Uncharacterized protein n=1 Tax=Cotesia congregata TaxID=51543 RepID=A0A8J2MDJ5_COTCN|nr:GSCOCG00009325001-RA-CDS [Cotesia congregata]CAG5083376.1 Protein of unknown function [Cotesia congregata]
MRHETFHDTTDLKKRKPNRLRGTPANKYSHALSFACVLGFALGCNLFTRAEWAQPYLIRFFENTAPSVHQERQKWMINDPLINSIIKNKQEKAEGIVREDGRVYSSATY